MKTNFDIKKGVIRALTTITIVILGFGLVQFERVNFVTTYESLLAVFGGHPWILILSWGVVLTDIAALARIFTPETEGGKEPQIVQTLWYVWAVVSLLDMSLSWYFAALQMESHAVQAPRAAQEYMWLFPIITALVIWGVQFGLLYLFGQILDKYVHGRVTSKPIGGSIRSMHVRKPPKHTDSIPVSGISNIAGWPPLTKPGMKD